MAMIEVEALLIVFKRNSSLNYRFQEVFITHKNTRTVIIHGQR